MHTKIKMSHNIPFDIQVEIIKKLPVKSLIQFRSVSKTWKSLIDSSDFISRYMGQVPQLLLRYEDAVGFEEKYVSIVDDHTFPQQKVVCETIPPLDKDYYTIGTSHGLFCFYCYFRKLAVLWNPSIRKSVVVGVPNIYGNGLIYPAFRKHGTVVGFGVCCETADPKIVKITQINKWKDMEHATHIPWQVEVFTLSTGAWRSPYGTNLPRKSILFCLKQVVVDGFLYWLATDRITMDGGFRSSNNIIISFDITSEEFGEVKLPDSLAHQSRYELSMFKLRESLAVVDWDEDEMVFVVWMMKDGVSKTFTKLFVVNTHANALASGFRKSGEPIFEIAVDHGGPLVVYEPYSKRMYSFGINGIDFSFCVYPFMETMLLFDQPNLTVYNEKETLKIQI